MTKGVEIEKDVAAEFKALRRMEKRFKLEYELSNRAVGFTSQSTKTARRG